MSAGEFSGRPFVAGSLTGIRAFKVDQDGFLTGVVHEQRWLPGANDAECRLGEMGRMMVQLNEKMRGSITGCVPRGHHLAGLGCQCGFYAYFKGRNTYMRGENAAAIVEGYGVCTVGSRGFRAEKARLVALIAPRRNRFPRARAAWSTYLRGVRAAVRRPLHWPTHRAYRFIPMRPFGSRRLGNLLSDCERTGRLLQAAIGFVVAVCALYLLDGWSHWVLWFVGMSILWAVPERTKPSGTPPLSPGEFLAVRRNYPDVPVYRSRRAAVRRHPLTSPDRKAA
jgi:hypothetical protein